MLILILILSLSLSLSLSLFLLSFILCISFRSYHLSIILPFYRCIYLSADHVRLLIHHLLIYPIGYLSVFVYVSIFLPFYLSFFLSISFYHFYLSTHLSSSAYLSVPMNTYLSIEASISVYGLSSMHPSTSPNSNPSVLKWLVSILSNPIS